jgi:hypothetical protein
LPSVIEDFAFIAKRVSEIRAARYHELGVSPPASPEQPNPLAQENYSAASDNGGFKYARGFEHLAAGTTPGDDWDCCFPA